MGMQNLITKDYLSDVDVYADIINNVMYQGEEVVKPENLQSVDTASVLSIFSSKEEQEKQRHDSLVMERIRDELKLASIYVDDTAAYVLIGIEAQTSVHYAMPVRGLVYDALQYAQQVKKYQALHRARGDKASSAEFLSGMHKEDKLTPVITLVVYFGSTPWDGPRRLSDMMKDTKRQTAKFIQDYELPVIEPCRMTDEELDRFKTDFGDVFRFLKYAGDKEQMKHLLNNRSSYQHMRRQAAQLLSLCAGLNVNTSNDGEVINMCKAWDDHRLSGIQEGRAEGRQENAIDFVHRLKKYGATEDEISAMLQLPKAEVLELLNMPVNA